MYSLYLSPKAKELSNLWETKKPLFLPVVSEFCYRDTKLISLPLFLLERTPLLGPSVANAELHHVVPKTSKWPCWTGSSSCRDSGESDLSTPCSGYGYVRKPADLLSGRSTVSVMGRRLRESLDTKVWGSLPPLQPEQLLYVAHAYPYLTWTALYSRQTSHGRSS